MMKEIILNNMSMPIVMLITLYTLYLGKIAYRT